MSTATDTAALLALTEAELTGFRAHGPAIHGSADLTWKLAQEDTFWTTFAPTFLAISYGMWIRKIVKTYRGMIRDLMKGSK